MRLPSLKVSQLKEIKEIIEKAPEEMKILAQEILELSKRLHPVCSLIYLSLQYMFSHPLCSLQEKYTESEQYAPDTNILHLRNFIEFLQNAFISTKREETTKGAYAEIPSELDSKIKDLYSKSQFSCYKADDSRVSASLHDLFVRGKRYPIHDKEHLNDFLLPHSSILKEVFGVTVEQIIYGTNKIINNLSDPEILLREKCEQYLEGKNVLPLDLDIEENFDIEKITGWPQSFIKHFSAKIGEYESSTPLETMPIFQKPILEFDSKFYIFLPHLWTDNSYRLIQNALLKERPKYKEKWNKVQKDVSENLPFSLLSKILGEFKKVQNFKYQDSKAKESWFEGDGLIIFEKWLFIIEVKSGKQQKKSPAESFSQHKNAEEKLILKPAKQGLRFLEILKKNKKIHLYDKNMQFMETINLADFKKFLILTFSLEQLGHIATKVHPMVHEKENLKLKNEKEFIWSFSFDDFRVYRDLFEEKPIQFLQFLEERKSLINSSFHFLGEDELDFLGIYLEDTFRDIKTSTNKKGSKSRITMPLGYRDLIDKYYSDFHLYTFFKSKKPTKPDKLLPFYLIEIIRDLNLKRKPGFIEIGLFIYSLDKQVRDKINETMGNTIFKPDTEKKILPFTIPSKPSFSVSFIFKKPLLSAPQKDFNPRHYAGASMISFDKTSSLLLKISLDLENRINNVDFDWIYLQETNTYEKKKFHEELKKFASKGTLYKLNNKEKKIGRNDPCPCNSGKKFKRCHKFLKNL